MYNLGNQFVFDNKRANMNSACVLKGVNYRISILTERLVRIEYNKKGIFVDVPSQFALSRDFGIPKFDVNQDSKYMEVTTKYFKLTYQKESPITSSNLKIYVNDTDSIWYYGNPEARCNEASFTAFDEDIKRKFTKGLYSREGFASFDDSKSLLIDISGNFAKRPVDGVDIYVFIYKDDFSLALKDYFSLTGKPLLIPRYALGNWWSKNCAYTESTLNKMFNRFIRDEIPISVLLLDEMWHITEGKYKTGYTFEKKLINAPDKLISDMHKRGVRVGVNINPIEGIYPHEEAYSKIIEYVKIPGNKIIGFAPFNPQFLDIFMKLLLHPLENIGIDFFWLDYPIKDASSQYILTHYMYLDSGRLERKRNMLLSKNPSICAHRYGILDTGRTNVSFDTLKMLPYINVSASNIGVSWWSSSIGGYTGGMEDAELYLRSVELGCFSPIFRISVDGGRYYKREPWKWDVKTFEIVKDYMRLRHRLVPYIYSEAYKYYESGITLIRPLYHTNKEMFFDPLYKNEYYFGPSLLISPLTDKKDPLMNRVVHKFYLPEGTWYDFKNGKKFPGNRSYVSFFKDEDYPVFAKSGAIIPMDKNVNNSLVVPNELEIHIFPGMNNAYELYEDDGVTNLYKNGYYLKTIIDYNYQANNYTVIIRSIEGKTGIIPNTRNYKIRFRNTLQAPSVSANFDGTPLECNSYTLDNDFIVEVKDVKTIGQLVVNCKGKGIEIDSVRLINEDIDSIISDLEVETHLKDKIASILFSNLTIKKKRILIRKLKKDKLDPKFIKMFLRLLEYIEQI